MEALALPVAVNRGEEHLGRKSTSALPRQAATERGAPGHRRSRRGLSREPCLQLGTLRKGAAELLRHEVPALGIPPLSFRGMLANETYAVHQTPLGLVDEGLVREAT